MRDATSCQTHALIPARHAYHVCNFHSLLSLLGFVSTPELKKSTRKPLAFMIPELVKAMDKQCDLRELRSQTADREFQAIARKQLSLDGLRPLALSIAKQVEFLMIACLLASIFSISTYCPYCAWKRTLCSVTSVRRRSRSSHDSLQSSARRRELSWNLNALMPMSSLSVFDTL